MSVTAGGIARNVGVLVGLAQVASMLIVAAGVYYGGRENTSDRIGKVEQNAVERIGKVEQLAVERISKVEQIAVDRIGKVEARLAVVEQQQITTDRAIADQREQQRETQRELVGISNKLSEVKEAIARIVGSGAPRR